MAASIIGYPDTDRGTGHVKDWFGRVLGTCRVISRRKTPRSHVSSEQIYYRCTIDAIEYHGRGAGAGMSLVLRPVKRRGR